VFAWLIEKCMVDLHVVISNQTVFLAFIYIMQDTDGPEKEFWLVLAWIPVRRGSSFYILHASLSFHLKYIMICMSVEDCFFLYIWPYKIYIHAHMHDTLDSASCITYNFVHPTWRPPTETLWGSALRKSSWHEVEISCLWASSRARGWRKWKAEMQSRLNAAD
jgi:hypothetical protein